MNFGWKKKAETLRMIILSAAHQLAKPLAPGIAKVLDIYARAHKAGDARQDVRTDEILAEMGEVTALTDDEKPMWEPVDLYGWTIQATLYLKPNDLNPGHVDLWWLVHAVRKSEQSPSEKDIALLDKVLVHLGADVARDMIIGPRSGPPEAARMPFGWWTWRNTQPLYEVQVNKDKTRPKEMMRVVPLGTAATDGYEPLEPDKP